MLSPGSSTVTLVAHPAPGSPTGQLVAGAFVLTRVVITWLPVGGLFTVKEPVILTDVERIHGVEAFVKATNAEIKTGGNQPMYVPSHDYIVMPPAGAFRTVEHFYATELHEMGHWAGAEKRLNRDLKNRFGTKAYAAEELVAELTAAFLCAHLGIQGELRHAGYIADWIRLLKEDDRAIFTAASKASQAADFLRSFSEDTSAQENEHPA